MGLLQKAVETYDAHLSLVGKSVAEQEMLAPICHLMTKADIEILLDQDGSFLDAHSLDKTEPKIPIPATESSGGRTSKAVPHPLCDQLKYLSPYSGEPYALYVSQLESWAASSHSHPKLIPVLTYVKGGSILRDLEKCGVVQLDKNGHPENENALVRWRVLLESSKTDSACWTDPTLFEAFIQWYMEQRSTEDMGFCMVSGKMEPIANQHPRGVVSRYGNAKLISANDKRGFTYRGRFTQEQQALTVGYEASQKAHNAIRWLVAQQRKYYGGRLFLCWNPQGIQIPNQTASFLPYTPEPIVEPSDYQEKLKNTLLAGKEASRLTGLGTEATAVLAAFDAVETSSGRLALTDYHEFTISDYLQRLYRWDSRCCWEKGKFGIQAPTLPQIVNNAFGTQREKNNTFRMETDDKVFRQQLQRLIDCRISSGQRFPEDIVRLLVRRATTPQSYERGCWLNILFTACAAIKKYRYDQFKEEWNVTLDKKKQDRSYLFGQLLAIAEKVERDTYAKEETREPNAMQMMTVFSRRPLSTWRILEEKLNPYFRRLEKPALRIYYKNLIGNILSELDNSGEDLNKPLEDIYLLGYYSMRKELYTKKEQKLEE